MQRDSNLVIRRQSADDRLLGYRLIAKINELRYQMTGACHSAPLLYGAFSLQLWLYKWNITTQELRFLRNARIFLHQILLCGLAGYCPQDSCVQIVFT